MSVIVVVGGQYGSEGKGKFASYLSLRMNPTCAVRCGGPNSGHTVIYKKRKYILQQLPSAIINPNSKLFIAAGAIVNLNLLRREMRDYSISTSRILVDRNAAIVTEEDARQEKKYGLREKIGSTLSGTGWVTSRKILRDPNLTLAKHSNELRKIVGDVTAELNEYYDRKKTILIEGTQGFGLSINHSNEYPYLTSRDTSAAGFVSEAGISPVLIDSIVMAIRSYPIRVQGNSGPFRDEITWEEIQERSNSPKPIGEYSTVTKRLRRVAEFDFDGVKRACVVNRPSVLAIQGIDYISFDDFGKKTYDDLTRKSRAFVKRIEEKMKVRVGLISTGPDTEDMVDISGE